MSCKVKTILGVFIFASVCTAQALAELLVGNRLPPLERFDLEGSLPADREGRVMLVDFWASWCGPCKQSFPALDALNAEFAAKGLVIVGVSVDESSSAFSGFVKKMSPRFAVLRDRTQKLVGEIKIPTMPSSYLVDRRGVVRFVHAGFHENTEKLLRTELVTLLEEKL